MSAALLLEIIRQRRGVVLVAALCLIAAGGLMSFRLFWQEPRLESRRAEWFAKREQAGGPTRNPVEAYRQGKADLAAVQQRIPQRNEFVRILGDLYEHAGNNRLALGGITYKPLAAKDSSLLAYELTVTAAGSYAAVKSFVADLERMEEMVVIDGFTVTASKEDGGQTVDVKLLLTAYFRTEGT